MSADLLDQATDPDVEEEDLAGRSSATLLITASTRRETETIARRIHQIGPRATGPFVRIRAGALPVEPWRLEEHCAALLEAAAGGTLFLMDVDEMPAIVQGVLIDLLAGLQRARVPSAAVRLVSGTTVSLFDRVAGGSFSDRLFYRLNVLHLVVGHATGERRRDMAEPLDGWQPPPHPSVL